MKKYVFYTLLLAIFASVTLTGCKYEEEECDCSGSEPVAYETLTDYLKSIDMDINHVLTNTEWSEVCNGCS